MKIFWDMYHGKLKHEAGGLLPIKIDQHKFTQTLFGLLWLKANQHLSATLTFSYDRLFTDNGWYRSTVNSHLFTDFSLIHNQDHFRVLI